MRLWQMVIDGWTSAGGRPDTLQYLGIHHITNNTALTSMRLELARQNTQPGQTITTTPADPTWDQNPFARCGSRVAQALSQLAHASIRAKSYLKRPGMNDDLRDETNMVIEFGEFEEQAPLPSATIDPQLAQELAEEPRFDLSLAQF